MAGASSQSTPDPADDPVEDHYAKARAFWQVGMFVSNLGSAMVSLTNAYLIFEQSRSVGVIALIAVCWSVPPLLLPITATYLVNRFGGPRTFMVRYLSSAVLALIPIALAITGNLTTVALLVWCLVMSTSSGLFSPSATVVKRMLAPGSLSPDFNAVATRNAALASVLGILVGGVTLATLGPVWIYSFNALSYIPVAFTAIPLLGNAVTSEVARQPFLRAFPILFGPHGRRDLHAACLFTALGILISGYTVTLPAIAHSVGSSPGYLALLQVSAVLGGLFTATAIRYLRGKVRWGHMQRACLATMGICVLALGWASHLDGTPALTLALCAVVIAPIGLVFNLDQALLNALVQLFTPEDSQGVIFTYYALIPLVMGPIGQGIIGVLADSTSVSAALTALGVFTMALVMIGPHLKMRAAFDTMSISFDTMTAGEPRAVQ